MLRSFPALKKGVLEAISQFQYFLSRTRGLHSVFVIMYGWYRMRRLQMLRTIFVLQ
jgi:hypothetical protein